MKLNLHTMYEILKQENNNGYIAFNRVHKLNTMNNRKYYGYRYIIEKPLTNNQIEKLNSFSNVVLSSCTYKYAPEIRYNTIIVMDNNLSTVNKGEL